MLRTANWGRRIPFNWRNSPLTLANFSRARHSHHEAAAPKVTIPQLVQMARDRKPIVVLTAHDSFTARLADAGGVDVLLVGDSLAMVAMGLDSTNEITLNDMIYHSRAVRRGAKRPFLVADLPFGSYEKGSDQTLDSAIRMIKEGHAECVKFEGGCELAASVEKLSAYGLPCMPHIGLTPQRQIQTGGFRVQGRTAEAALSVLKDAILLERAGATMLLLEGVPARVGEEISRRVEVPVIGIGAGPHTHGQVLVHYDMLGGFDGFRPKFVKQYANLLQFGTEAIERYAADVRDRAFPGREHRYVMNAEEYARFLDGAEKISK